jgi:hypothetical protein
MRNMYNIWEGKSERKRSLGRPERRWEDNITMDVREIVCESVDWINLAEDRDQWRAVVIPSQEKLCSMELVN